MNHTVSASPYRLVANVKTFEQLIDQMPGWIECERALMSISIRFTHPEDIPIKMAFVSLTQDAVSGQSDTAKGAFIDLLGKLGAV